MLGSPVYKSGRTHWHRRLLWRMELLPFLLNLVFLAVIYKYLNSELMLIAVFNLQNLPPPTLLAATLFFKVVNNWGGGTTFPLFVLPQRYGQCQSPSLYSA